MSRRLLSVLAAFLFLLAMPASSFAQGPPDTTPSHVTPPALARATHSVADTVTTAQRDALIAAAQHARPGRNPLSGATVYPGDNSGGPLSYHGGNVLNNGMSPKSVLWLPPNWGDATVDGQYANVLNAYVQALSRTTQYSGTPYPDVFASLQQYYGTWSGSNHYIKPDVWPPPDLYVMTDTASEGCSESGFAHCVTDAEIKQMIRTWIGRTGQNYGYGDPWVVYLPSNVGINGTPGNEFMDPFCAYHGYDSAGGPHQDMLIYAVFGYAATTRNGATCDSGQRPNGTTADATINLASHEFSETFSDVTINAWYDSKGEENGDKCGWVFGNALGGSSGALYNQLISGWRFYTQLEWSNQDGGCVATGI